MDNHIALTPEQRKVLFEKLSKAIDDTEMNMNEYIFASADLLKTTFWIGLSSGKSEAENAETSDRIAKAINGIMDVLSANTESIGEDVIAVASVMFEAVNHIIAQTQAAASVEG